MKRGAIRRSTAILLAVFIVTLTAYILIRPAPAHGVLAPQPPPTTGRA